MVVTGGYGCFGSAFRSVAEVLKRQWEFTVVDDFAPWVYTFLLIITMNIYDSSLVENVLAVEHNICM